MLAAWPNVAILAVVALGALVGFRRGLVRELAGVVAIAVGIAAATHYPGMWDAALESRVPFELAHAAGAALYGLTAYAVTRVCAGLLARVVSLPFLGLANAVLGLAVGAAKAVVLVWAIVYVALLFPLPGRIRADLRAAPLVALVGKPNARIDRSVEDALPGFLRPLAGWVLDADHG